jgi:hypothetical protein
MSMRRKSLFAVGLCLALALLGAAGAQAQVSCTGKPAWTDGCNQVYTIGNQYTYQNSLYQVRQTYTNTCGAGWTPAAVGSLWTLVGACSGTAATPTTAPRATATTAPRATATTAPRTTATATTRPRATATATTRPAATATATSSGTGNCAGVPAFATCTAYPTGSKVVFNNTLYHSIANVPSNRDCPPQAFNPSNDNWWVNDGACSGSGGGGATPTVAPTTPPGTKYSAPYIDVSPGSGSAIMQLASNGSGNKHYSLAFILGAGCKATWFGAYDMSSAEATAIGTRINELKAAGGNVIISFGGAAAPELANVCPDAASLRAQYQAVVNKYQPMACDFDIEDFNPTAIDIRNQALAAGIGCEIHYTLGVLETGMTSAQISVLQNAKSHNVNVALVNIMAMDYGHAVSDMYAAAVSAAQATRSQLSSVGYGSAKLGITPMIGVNDSGGETFTTGNASSLASWANSNGVTELAFWSVGRDNGGCAGGGAASPSCSGVSQSNFQFSSIFHNFAN